jgi:pimeloyl-ACP methyl ester carboxylesterase
MKAPHFITAFLVGLFVTAVAQAESIDVTIPLHDGKIEFKELSATICRQLHLPSFPLGNGSVKIKGWAGSLFVQSLNAALGEGCQFRVEKDQLLLHLDPAQLPHTVPQAQAAVRRYVANDFPDATARQEKLYGLFLPENFDAHQPLVILIHGLDDGQYTMRPIGDALSTGGFQVAYFVYPAAGPIDDDANLLAEHLQALQQAHPDIKLNLLGYSMGGLVARRYVEGKDYAGGVDHLIEVGTPNHGSDWAWASPILAAHENYFMARSDSNWRASWLITDGLGEATRDLIPDSKFLHRLNRLPRRADVRYTIIAGNKNVLADVAGDLVGSAAGEVPGHNWLSTVVRTGLLWAGMQLDSATAPGDGPVSLRSAKLDGVSDFVVIPADHIELAEGAKGKPPAALPIIEDRLGK